MVETVGGQGYRFCGRDRSGPFTVTADVVVGRQRELEALDGRFRQVARGQRQCLFLTGESGVGRTTLVVQWLSRLSKHEVIRIGWGKCAAYQEEREAYRPLLEAFSRLRPERPDDLPADHAVPAVWEWRQGVEAHHTAEHPDRVQPADSGGPQRFRSWRGLGDIQLLTHFAPPTGNWLIGVGPCWLFPTSTNDHLGRQQWGIGPSGVIGYKAKHWMSAIVPQY
jgi:Cdc6-like AAA superfamily ATPase